MLGYYYFEKQVLSFCHGPIHKEHDLKLINPATLVHEGEWTLVFLCKKPSFLGGIRLNSILKAKLNLVFMAKQ